MQQTWFLLHYLMNTYISHQRPSWRIWFLGLLGLTDLPIKVNCWYCNRDSFLLRGSKHTEKNWYCNICENRNVKDENGEIVDCIPVMRDASLKRTASNHQHSAKTTRPASRALCKNCENNQRIIYQLLSDYVRDEDDPQYEYYLKTADQYKSSLDAKYPLCKDCQIKVDTLFLEQQSDMRQRRFHEKLLQSLETKPPKKQSFRRFFTLGLFWLALHSATILICLYASYVPPHQTYQSIADLWLDFRESGQIWAQVVYELAIQCKENSYSTIITAVLQYASQLLVSFLFEAPRVTSNFIQCVSAHETSPVICGWTFSTWSLYLLLASLLSCTWINWHPRVSRTFVQDSSRLKYWFLYKSTQKILFVARIGLIALLYFKRDKETLAKTMKCAWIVYSSALLLSVLCVRIPPTQWPIRQVGYKKAVSSLQKSCSNLQSFAVNQASKIGRHSMDAAQYLTPQTSVDSLADTPLIKRPKSVDNELDDLVTGIDKIGF